MRTLLSSMLRALGFGGVTVESDAETTLSLVKSGWANVALVDWMMPDRSGIDIVRAIRCMPGDPGRIPIIIVTAHASPTRLKIADRSGVNAVLCKPVSAKALAQRLQSVIQANPSETSTQTPPKTDPSARIQPNLGAKQPPVFQVQDKKDDTEMDLFYV